MQRRKQKQSSSSLIPTFKIYKQNQINLKNGCLLREINNILLLFKGSFYVVDVQFTGNLLASIKSYIADVVKSYVTDGKIRAIISESTSLVPDELDTKAGTDWVPIYVMIIEYLMTGEIETYCSIINCLSSPELKTKSRQIKNLSLCVQSTLSFFINLLTKQSSEIEEHDKFYELDPLYQTPIKLLNIQTFEEKETRLIKVEANVEKVPVTFIDPNYDSIKTEMSLKGLKRAMKVHIQKLNCQMRFLYNKPTVKWTDSNDEKWRQIMPIFIRFNISNYFKIKSRLELQMSKNVNDGYDQTVVDKLTEILERNFHYCNRIKLMFIKELDNFNEKLNGSTNALDSVELTDTTLNDFKKKLIEEKEGKFKESESPQINTDLSSLGEPIIAMKPKTKSDFSELIGSDVKKPIEKFDDIVTDELKFKKGDTNSVMFAPRSTRATGMPNSQLEEETVNGKLIKRLVDKKTDFSEYVKYLAFNHLRAKGINCDINHIDHKDLITAQLISNNFIWKNPIFDLTKIGEEYREESAAKLGELLIKALKESKLPDPQNRLYEIDCKTDETAITIEGVNRRLINFSDIESIIEKETRGELLMYCLKTDPMPIFTNDNLIKYFHGDVNKIIKDASEMRLNSIQNRLERMAKIKVQTDSDWKEFKIANQIVINKLKSTDTTQKFLKLEYKKPLIKPLTHLELSNRITTRQILSEVIEELENIAKLRSLIYHINVKIGKRRENGDEVHEYVDVEKLITCKQSECGVKISEVKKLIDEFKVEYKGQEIRCIDLLKVGQTETDDSYYKQYGPLTVFAFRKKRSQLKESQRYHVVFMVKSNGQTVMSPCYIYNQDRNDTSLMDESTLLSLRGVIDDRSIIYHAFDCYVRNPNFRKADMMTSLEFAVKERKNQITCWQQLVDKWKGSKLCFNTSDILFAYYLYLLATDSNTQVSSLFLCFHAANRQTPIEIIKCCGAALRPAVISEKLKGETVKKFTDFISNNFDELFIRDQINKLKGKITMTTDEFMSTASSNESIVDEIGDFDKSKLTRCQVSKDEKFKTFINQFGEKSGQIDFNQLTDWFKDRLPYFTLVSKSNVKSMREIYIFDPVTSIGASIETKIAKIVSKSVKSDLILKEKEKARIISQAIDEAKKRVKNQETANILIFEGDGTKYNQHMILEMFSRIYGSIDKSLNQMKSGSSEWKIFIDKFYEFYSRKRMIVDLTKFKKELLIYCLQKESISQHGQLPLFKPHVNDFLLFIYQKIPDSKTKDILLTGINFKQKELEKLIKEGRVKQQDIDYIFEKFKSDKMKILETLKCPYRWYKCVNIVNQIIDEQFIGQHIKEVTDEISKWINQCLINDRFDRNEGFKFLEKWDEFQNQQLVIPATYGMSQGILACTSSIFSSLALQFVGELLKEEGLIDWHQDFATSDDMLMIMTTKSRMNEKSMRTIRLFIEEKLSQLNLACNEIKSSLHCNPDTLVFNSLYYYINDYERPAFAKLDHRKLPAIGRFWKNLFDEQYNEPCINFNNISTNLKLMFDSFNFSKLDRLIFIKNGRFVSNIMSLNNYYNDANKVSIFQREFFCSWPSSHESCDELSEYTYFNRKELDLLWFVKNIATKILNGNEKMILDIETVVGDEIVVKEMMMEDDLSLLIRNGEMNFLIRSEDLKKCEFDENRIKFVNKFGQTIQLIFDFKFKSYEEFLVNSTDKKIKTDKQQLRLKTLTPEQLHKLFLSIYGSNLVPSETAIGFRIDIKPMRVLRRQMNALASIDVSKEYTPNQMFNFFTHVMSDPPQRDRYAIRFKLMGTPHMKRGRAIMNYQFNNFNPKIDKDTFTIEMTEFINEVYKLNINKPLQYGFLPDEQFISANSITAKTAINFFNEIGAIKTPKEMLINLMMMKKSKNFKFKMKNSLMTGMIVPYIPNLTFGGLRSIPTIGKTLREYLDEGMFNDPWIIRQIKCGENSWKHDGLLYDNKNKVWYHVNGSTIKSRFKLKPYSITTYPITPASDIPICLIEYSYQENVTETLNFLNGARFSKSGVWKYGKHQHTLAKQRSIPMFTYHTTEYLKSISVEQRHLIINHLRRRTLAEEILSNIRFKAN